LITLPTTKRIKQINIKFQFLCTQFDIYGKTKDQQWRLIHFEESNKDKLDFSFNLALAEYKSIKINLLKSGYQNSNNKPQYGVNSVSLLSKMNILTLAPCSTEEKLLWDVSEISYFDYNLERKVFDNEYSKLYEVEKTLLKSIK